MDRIIIFFLVIIVIAIVIAIITAISDVVWEKRCDDKVFVKSAKAVESYDVAKYIKEDNYRLDEMARTIDYKMRSGEAAEYVILVKYVSPAGKKMLRKKIILSKNEVQTYIDNPALWMSKSEYNKQVKEQNKEQLEKKRHDYYEKINAIIDTANKNRDRLIISGDKDELDKLVANLFDRTVNSVNKIKDINSDEWNVIGNIINSTSASITNIVKRSSKILEYYKSNEFLKIKTTVSSLMKSQKEFNDYIDEKAQSVSKFFGIRVARNETSINDEYNYIRPYKKSITPFTAEVSAQVFASAENNPIEYIIKNFYPNKDQYPAQIQKLQFLIEELETLREAKDIIDNYKKEYQQYITEVPSYVLDNDEDGFYSRLGFANISESVLTVEYKFSYTSGGGFAQRSFTVPMTEETIVELVNALQSKLTMSSFTKEQRALMTSKLRQQIKERDDYTCKICGNTTHKEPNLLLEIDHIVPVSKGGYTVSENLQTLCWKCNRSKSDKLI